MLQQLNHRFDMSCPSGPGKYKIIEFYKNKKIPKKKVISSLSIIDDLLIISQFVTNNSEEYFLCV